MSRSAENMNGSRRVSPSRRAASIGWAFLVAVFILSMSSSVFASTDVYEIRGTPDFGIYQLN
ncbi:MAG TPA: hypothetical protein VF333_10365, partial [Pyrinomonadaceae bacterium]